MAEESKQKFDPDATVAQPVPGAAPGDDPDATVALPAPPLQDPDATINGPIQAEPDPEATFTGVAAKKPPEAERTDIRFDPDATVNPAERAGFEDLAARLPGKSKPVRKNPFAPKSLPESVSANLAALGGLNPLIAMANPILGAVPQIRRTLKHPDPDGLRANLRDQIDSLQTTASFAEVSDASVQGAVYALCALLDESAGATPWGRTWIDNGLLKEVCAESGGGEGFFTRLEAISSSQDPDNTDNADLLEFYDVCLALGFEGRYRKAEGGRQALNEIRGNLYSLIARRRPRPSELSVHWRSAIAEAAAAPALQMAAEVAARISAQQAAGASAEDTLPPVKRSFLSRVPRRVVWSALGSIAAVMLVLYMAALRLLDDETKAALAPQFAKMKASAGRTKTAAAPAPAAASTAAATPSASAALASALQGQPVTLKEDAGRITLSLNHLRQFSAGGTRPAPELRPVIQKITAALDGIPGAIVVTGHADATPAGARFASNAELSAARARAVAQLMAPKLAASSRVSAVGKGDAEPLAPGDTPEDRARNRRVTITLSPTP
jgi:type VI secretion system protein ImpK